MDKDAIVLSTLQMHSKTIPALRGLQSKMGVKQMDMESKRKVIFVLASSASEVRPSLLLNQCPIFIVHIRARSISCFTEGCDEQ